MDIKKGDLVVVTDQKHKSFYMSRMFVLWISKDGFYCLGSKPDQDISECYMGESQIKKLANDLSSNSVDLDGDIVDLVNEHFRNLV